jgi:cyclopropane fatty-acyl-phospholipid synthase-like methyltransferase
MFRNYIASQFKKPSGLPGIVTSNLMVQNNQKNYDRLILGLDLQPQDKLLEIGYGPGIGIRMVAEASPTCTIHGIDFSKLMYKRASKYNKQLIETGRVQLQYGDFLKAPALNNNYDKILCLNVIYFWNELRAPFEKVLALLKTGGSFHIYMADIAILQQKKAPDSVFNKYTVEQVVEVLKAVGFNEVGHHEEKGHYINARR